MVKGGHASSSGLLGWGRGIEAEEGRRTDRRSDGQTSSGKNVVGIGLGVGMAIGEKFAPLAQHARSCTARGTELVVEKRSGGFERQPLRYATVGAAGAMVSVLNFTSHPHLASSLTQLPPRWDWKCSSGIQMQRPARCHGWSQCACATSTRLCARRLKCLTWSLGTRASSVAFGMVACTSERSSFTRHNSHDETSTQLLQVLCCAISSCHLSLCIIVSSHASVTGSASGHGKSLSTNKIQQPYQAFAVEQVSACHQ